MEFFLKASEDFFPKDTSLQLYILNSGDTISEDQFEEKRKNRIIEFSGKLQKATVDKLSKCLEQIKDDIPENLHRFLF
jgi:hypothetical protein